MIQRHPECIEQESALVLFASGELEPGAQRLLDAHCAVCANCRAERDDQQRIAGILRMGLIRSEQRPGLWAGIEAQLQREGRIGAPLPGTAAPAAQKPLLRFPWKAAMASMAAAAIFGLGLWMGRDGGVNSDPAPQPVVVAPAPANSGPDALPLNPRGLRRVSAAELPLAVSAEPLSGASAGELEWIPPSPGASTASQQRLLH